MKRNNLVTFSWVMQVKSLANNNYSVNLYSKDVNLTGRILYMFQWRIQKSTIRFSESLFLSQVIQAFVEVERHDIFQTH